VPLDDDSWSPCSVLESAVHGGVMLGAVGDGSRITATGISSSFVIAVEVPTDKAPDHWIFCGAALILQLNA
jgi:hypothetical protein